MTEGGLLGGSAGTTEVVKVVKETAEAVVREL